MLNYGHEWKQKKSPTDYIIFYDFQQILFYISELPSSTTLTTLNFDPCIEYVYKTYQHQKTENLFFFSKF